MKIQTKNTNTVVSINGVAYSTNSIEINGSKVIINNTEQVKDLTGSITIVVHGDVDSICTESGKVTANTVTTVTTASGSVTCGDVIGSVTTASGNISCGDIEGSATTMFGNISR